MKKSKRLAYDPGGAMSFRSPTRAAATPLDLRDFREEQALSAAWTTYHPTWRDKATDWVLGLIGDKPSLATRTSVERLIGNATPATSDFISPVDFTPAGALFSADEAYGKFKLGNYSGAAWDAVGTVPGSALSILGKGAKAVKGIGPGLGSTAPHAGRAAVAGSGNVLDMYRAAQAGDDLRSRTRAKAREMFDRAGFNVSLDGASKAAAAKIRRLPNRIASRNSTEQAVHISDVHTVRENQGDVEFDPPKYPQRSFRNDYPDGAEIRSDGRLAKDIDGRDLTAKYVAGRVYQGRPDVRFREKELRQVIRNIIHPRHEPPRKGYYLASSSFLDELLGRDRVHGITTSDRMGQPSAVFIANHLNEADIGRVLAHEAGHVLHETGKRAPDSAKVVRDVTRNGIIPEMQQIYHGSKVGHMWPVAPEERWASLIDPVTRERKPLYTPLSYGYPEDKVWPEYVAEAFSTYMTAPNTMKTLWPKTAARLRAFVNEHEELKKFIQLNGLAGPAAIGLAGYRTDDRKHPRNTRDIAEY